MKPTLLPRPFALLLTLLTIAPASTAQSAARDQASTAKSEIRTVARVIDGDTVQLENGERVRLIGIDTPETVHPMKPVEAFGKEASEFTRKMCEGKRVRLEYDWQRLDKYHRTLAYLHLEDGTFVNAEIVKQGYGHAYTVYPFKYLDQFREYERTAREKGLGLWSQRDVASEPGQARPPTTITTTVVSAEPRVDPQEDTVYITRTGAKYHRENCRYLAKSKIAIKRKDAIARGYTACKVCKP